MYRLMMAPGAETHSDAVQPNCTVECELFGACLAGKTKTHIYTDNDGTST
jgi:hypothetical protein